MATRGSRSEKVKRIFYQFDVNHDGGLNREEMAALVVVVNPRVKFSDEQINAILDEVFQTYGDFIDGEKGLTYEGLSRTYDDGAGDVDRDFDALGLELSLDKEIDALIEQKSRQVQHNVNGSAAAQVISGGGADSAEDGLLSMPEEYSKYLKSLNDRQREAACSDIATPLMIVAGPGSGKTSTMVGRVLMLLNEGISGSNILAMTFTIAAASEMRERIAKVAGKASAKELTISTFHSFSLQLCQAHAEKLERTPEFLIYGHGQQRRAIIEAVRLSENGKSRPKHSVGIDSEESNGSWRMGGKLPSTMGVADGEAFRVVVGVDDAATISASRPSIFFRTRSMLDCPLRSNGRDLGLSSFWA
ncbi:hypothetical protein ACLB2K_066945 [Fragaria x ananassa]